MPRKKTKKKVLIIDDADLFVAGLKELLEQENFEVLTAGNGIDGLLTASQNKIDLVLLDMAMPELGGMAVLKKMRSEPWGKDVPILILTSSPASSSNFRESLQFGESDYLVKDKWEASKIVEYVKQTLSIV